MFSFLNRCMDAWDNDCYSKYERVIGFILWLVLLGTFYFCVVCLAAIFC